MLRTLARTVVLTVAVAAALTLSRDASAYHGAPTMPMWVNVMVSPAPYGWMGFHWFPSEFDADHEVRVYEIQISSYSPADGSDFRSYRANAWMSPHYFNWYLKSGTSYRFSIRAASRLYGYTEASYTQYSAWHTIWFTTAAAPTAPPPSPAPISPPIVCC